MISVEVLANEGRSPVSIFFQFRLKASKSTKSIHAFFEGREDLSFYTNFLQQRTTEPKHIYTYICDGKRDVYKTYKKVMQESYKGFPLFFVDKDLSDILNEQLEEELRLATNIYTTEHYSIENYLVSEGMLVRVWRELFHFNNVDVNFSPLLEENFQRNLELFYQFMLPIMAWVVCLRRSGKKLCIDDIKFPRLFDWDANLTLLKSEEARQKGDFQLLESMCKESVPAEYIPDIDTTMNELRLLPPKAYIQGKLELCFFVKFVDKLRKLLSEHHKQHNGSISIKPLIDEGNAIEILGPRLTIPQSLEDFLRINLSGQSEHSAAL